MQATPRNNGSDVVRQKPAGTVTGPRQDVQKTVPHGDMKGHGDPHNGHHTPPPPPPPHHHGDVYPHHHGHVGYHPYHHHIYHPYWHRNIYLHRVYWNPWCPVVYIDGFWIYTHSYYFTDYSVRTVYVREYNTVNIEIIDYVVDDYYTYCIQQVGFERYFRVYDGNNRLIAQQTINRRYEKLVYDEISNGVWCIDNRDRENLFFIVDGDGHLIYYKE